MAKPVSRKFFLIAPSFVNLFHEFSFFFRIISFFSDKSLFLEFSKVTEGGTYQVVHRTEVAPSSGNPYWRKFSIPVRSFCGNDYERDIQVICYDHSSMGSHTELGIEHADSRNISREGKSEDGSLIFIDYISQVDSM